MRMALIRKRPLIPNSVLRQVGVPRGESEGEGDAKWIELTSEETGEVIGAACVRVYSRRAVLSLMRDVAGRRSISGGGMGAFPDVGGGGGVDEVVKDLVGAAGGGFRGEYVSESWGNAARAAGNGVRRSTSARHGDDDRAPDGAKDEWGDDDDHLYEEGSETDSADDGGNGGKVGLLERGSDAPKMAVKHRGAQGGTPNVDLSILASLNDRLYLDGM
jgi:hypothetical protein